MHANCIDSELVPYILVIIIVIVEVEGHPHAGIPPLIYVAVCFFNHCTKDTYDYTQEVTVLIKFYKILILVPMVLSY